MIEATSQDKARVIEILTASFDTNQSVNYLIPQDHKRTDRIRALMDYSFEMCRMFGKVYLSDDKSACALVSFPDIKKTTLRSLFVELKVIFNSIGFGNIGKAVRREKAISSYYPRGERLYYLWFIGVHPRRQNQGVGAGLIQEIIEEAMGMDRRIFLETSTIKNISWYQKFGFYVYKELDFGYKLFMIRREL